ncbi:hypothetical protein KKE45_03715, partial [Patescibacteria group bacterium]|nr:hypothetical protein [Patescibacteria group bacterium]
MNKKILILFLILTSLIIPPIISAQESTDSSTTTSEEIEKIRKSVQEKVQEKLKDIVEIKTTKKAWIGTVSKIENTSITLENDNNKRVLICANNTVFIDLNRNKTSIDKLKEDQIVLAMGYSQDDQPNTLDTKRLIISQNNIDELRSSIILGKIADV